ncbi:hypothetical protein ACWCWD_35120 [Streptomyces sp. NPDC001493]
MDDAFTLVRRAVGLLPEDVVTESGWTAEDVREAIGLQEWEMALDMLDEIADARPAPVAFWRMLAEAARQMMLDRRRRWYEWRGWEAEHGTFRATLTLLGVDEGGRRSAFSGDGQLRPLWDIGSRTAGGVPDLYVARLWVESRERLGPGETAGIRLAPLRPGEWRHLRPGGPVTMHEGRPVVGVAEIVEVLPPRV